MLGVTFMMNSYMKFCLQVMWQRPKSRSGRLPKPAAEGCLVHWNSSLNFFYILAWFKGCQELLHNCLFSVQIFRYPMIVSSNSYGIILLSFKFTLLLLHTVTTSTNTTTYTLVECILLYLRANFMENLTIYITMTIGLGNMLKLEHALHFSSCRGLAMIVPSAQSSIQAWPIANNANSHNHPA